jgi:hypothetical protein
MPMTEPSSTSHAPALKRRPSDFAYCEGLVPYLPGTSPFHVKGEFYRQLARSVEHHDAKTGGAVLAALERMGLRAFATQVFLSSALYDVFPAPRIVMAIAEVRGWDVHELTARMGRAAIAAQMTGASGALLATLTTETFHLLFDRVIKHFDNFGAVAIEAQPCGARLVRSGVPLCVAEWWSLVTIPFTVAPLTAHGARDVTVDWRVEPRGRSRGVDCGNVIWQLRWAQASPA